MSKTNARIMHTPNGLGGDPQARPIPDFLQAARIRRATLENSVKWFLEDGDTVAARAAMVALNELNATIAAQEREVAMPPAFSDMIIVETCPVCGVQFVTAQSGPFICSDCLAEQAAYEADRADNARPYLS